jgi:hypothetical protein
MLTADSDPVLENDCSKSAGYFGYLRTWVAIDFESDWLTDLNQLGHPLLHRRSHEVRF